MRIPLRKVIAPFAAMVLAALFSGDTRSQEEGVPDAAHTLRVYLLDRQPPLPSLEDTAASMTLRFRSGRGQTILLARVSPGAGAAPRADPGIGMIRGFLGTTGALELFWKGSANPSVGPEKSPAPERYRTALQILRQVHQGPCFAAELPETVVSDVVSAWITVRRGATSWTSEEFQGPSVPAETAEVTLGAVENTLRSLREHPGLSESYMDLHPRTLSLLRDLEKLAPWGFLEETGEFERDRQWCLAIARAIEDACAAGDWGRLSTLTQEAQPRLATMRTLEKGPSPPAVPTPAPR